jgi:hypothetical protein
MSRYKTLEEGGAALLDAMRATLPYGKLRGHLDDACFRRLEDVGAVTLSEDSRELIVLRIYLAIESEDWRKRRRPPHLAALSTAASQAAALASTLRGEAGLAGYYGRLIKQCDHQSLSTHTRDR